MMKHWIWMVFAAGALGCETTPSASDVPEPRSLLPGVEWRLVAFELEGGRVVSVEDRTYALELLDEDTLHVKNDCNVCNGGYALVDGRLDVGLLACTRAACPPGSEDVRFLRALETATSSTIEGTTLRIVYDEGVLRFERR